MSVLVLGSEGFVGSAICDVFLADGQTVIGVDNYLKGFTPTEHFSHPNFHFRKYDLSNGVDASIFEGFEEVPETWIIAAATLGGISYFHDYAFDMIGYNSQLMSKILTSAITKRPKKIVYLSSSMVYENVNIFPSREEDVDAYPAPSSSYGFAKLAGERMVKALYDQHGIEYSICRLFNCIGPDERFELPFKQGAVHVLPEFVYQALTAEDSHKPVQLIGDGQQIRCFTDKRDLAEGIKLASEYGKNEIFNISTTKKTRIEDLLDIVWNQVHGHDATTLEGISLPYDVQVRIPDVHKAGCLLKFTPKYSLNDTVGEVIQWMTKQLAK